MSPNEARLVPTTAQEANLLGAFINKAVEAGGFNLSHAAAAINYINKLQQVWGADQVPAPGSEEVDEVGEARKTTTKKSARKSGKPGGK